MSAGAVEHEVRRRRVPPRRVVAALGVSLLTIAWLGALVGGFSVLQRYETDAGPAGEPPNRWPASSVLALDPARPTLLFFAHPRCPCTRASLEELDRLVARHGEELSMHVLFLAPAELDESWTRGALWERALAIPGVDVRADADGALARLFGVRTSGHVLLYAPGGALAFTGGITASRGHEGYNEGTRSISSWLAGRERELRRTPVFGCQIECESEECSGGSTP